MAVASAVAASIALYGNYGLEWGLPHLPSSMADAVANVRTAMDSLVLLPFYLVGPLFAVLAFLCWLFSQEPEQL